MAVKHAMSVGLKSLSSESAFVVDEYGGGSKVVATSGADAQQVASSTSTLRLFNTLLSMPHSMSTATSTSTTTTTTATSSTMTMSTTTSNGDTVDDEDEEDDDDDDDDDDNDRDDDVDDDVDEIDDLDDDDLDNDEPVRRRRRRRLLQQRHELDAATAEALDDNDSDDVDLSRINSAHVCAAQVRRCDSKCSMQNAVSSSS